MKVCKARTACRLACRSKTTEVQLDDRTNQNPHKSLGSEIAESTQLIV